MKVNIEPRQPRVPEIGSRLVEAVGLAALCHADHRRKGTEIPYVGHLLAVCGLVIHAGGDEDEAIAALLHDVLEDRPECVTPREIEARFGRGVLEIIEGCSDDLPDDVSGLPDSPKRRDAGNWARRKTRYLSHLRGVEPSVLRVSCADKVDNARAIVTDLRRHGDALWDRFNAGRKDQLCYYRGLVEVFRERRHDLGEAGGWLVDELERQVQEMDRLAYSNITA
ncbi:MAG TPA: HD domain-containing protein [Gemmatimonadota bacterium]|nr:HD domain-containing protein [Gemmatimonadota bacterium]